MSNIHSLQPAFHSTTIKEQLKVKHTKNYKLPENIFVLFQITLTRKLAHKNQESKPPIYS